MVSRDSKIVSEEILEISIFILSNRFKGIYGEKIFGSKIKKHQNVVLTWLLGPFGPINSDLCPQLGQNGQNIVKILINHNHWVPHFRLYPLIGFVYMAVYMSTKSLHPSEIPSNVSILEIWCFYSMNHPGNIVSRSGNSDRCVLRHNTREVRWRWWHHDFFENFTGQKSKKNDFSLIFWLWGPLKGSVYTQGTFRAQCAQN